MLLYFFFNPVASCLRGHFCAKIIHFLNVAKIMPIFLCHGLFRADARRANVKES